MKIQMLNDKVSATNIFNKVVYNNIVFFAFFRRLKMKKESERLNVGDRLQIEAMVSDKNISAQQIANKLKVDKTTIYRDSKEILSIIAVILSGVTIFLEVGYVTRVSEEAIVRKID